MDYALINRAMAVQPFFYLGFLFKKGEDNVVLSNKSTLIYTSAFLYILFVIAGFVFFLEKVLTFM